MDKMRKILTLLLTLVFFARIAGISYALRPISCELFLNHTEYLSGQERITDTLKASSAAPYENFTNIPCYQDGLQQLLKIAPVDPDSSVLDLGCGTGALTKLIADKISPKGRLFGIDISNDRAYIASKYFSGHDNVSILVQDASKLIGFEPKSIDNAFSANAIHLINNKSRFVGEINRILKSGGSFAFSTSYFTGSQSAGAQAAIKKIYIGALKKLKKRGITISGKKAKTYEVLSKADYVKLIEDSGLIVVAQKEITYNIELESLSGFFADPEISENMFPGIPYEIAVKVMTESLEEMLVSLHEKVGSSKSIARNWLVISARKPYSGPLILEKIKSLITNQVKNQAVLAALVSAA